jgi:hypothetical protein
MQTSLVARQPLQEFDLWQQEQLLAHLEHIDSCTVKQLISSPRDIELKPNGRLTVNDYALTPLAFKQLCRCVAAGLYGLVADVGAVIGNARSLDAYTSAALAVEIINKVVQLRFNAPDGISCKALILNAESKTVDGIVGARYRYVPSHQLFTSVMDTVEGELEVQFERASLSGRRFAFTLRNTATHHEIDNGQLLVPTLYFTNSEAGEAGIHAGAGFITEEAHMLGALRHIAHSNHEFDARLTKIMAGTIKDHKGLIEKFQFYEARLRAPLNLVHEMKINDKKRKEITRWIGKRIGTALAEDVMRKALFQGADGTTIPAKIAIDEVAQRTNRDLALTLAREGEGRYHTIRELCERAAFDIIS